MSRNTGFSLVELIVTISIAVIITTAVLVNYSYFREKVAVKKTAQEIALAIRQAQAYGLGVRLHAGSGTYPGYGVRFDISTPDTFILYADLNENHVYDGVSERVESFKIQTGERINSLCTNVKTSPPGTCGFSTIDIVFFRPKPLVIIRAGGSEYADGEIRIASSGGQTKTIVTLSTGQISVEN